MFIMCGVNRNGIISGIGRSRVAAPNAKPKSIPMGEKRKKNI